MVFIFLLIIGPHLSVLRALVLVLCTGFNCWTWPGDPLRCWGLNLVVQVQGRLSSHSTIAVIPKVMFTGGLRDLTIHTKETSMSCHALFVTLLRLRKIFPFMPFGGGMIYTHLYFHDLVVMTLIMQLAERRKETVMMILSTAGCLIVNCFHQDISELIYFFLIARSRREKRCSTANREIEESACWGVRGDPGGCPGEGW